jgi:hypothetical protein
VAHEAKAAARDAEGRKRLKRRAYESELAKLHAELVKLQEWVKQKKLKICVVFEGRDGAGKGGTIKAITERVSPRIFRVVALPAPTEREKTQMYAQRYLVHLPAGGEVVIFDRSWYNRAGVERVMGFRAAQGAGAAAGGLSDGARARGGGGSGGGRSGAAAGGLGRCRRTKRWGTFRTLPCSVPGSTSTSTGGVSSKRYPREAMGNLQVTPRHVNSCVKGRARTPWHTLRRCCRRNDASCSAAWLNKR